jgi:hypothetical protein
VAGNFGINGSSQSLPSAPTSAPGAAVAATAQQLVNAPGLVRVQLPLRYTDDQPSKPRKPAADLKAPRDLEGGLSPLAPEPVRNAGAGADLLGELGSFNGGTAQSQGAGSHELLPSKRGLIAYTLVYRGGAS